MAWYCAHILIKLQPVDPSKRTGRILVYENSVLLEGAPEADLYGLAEKIGKEKYIFNDSSLTLVDENSGSCVPAEEVFVGVRKVVMVSNHESGTNDERPGLGCELTYNELEFEVEADLDNYLDGKETLVVLRAEK